MNIIALTLLIVLLILPVSFFIYLVFSFISGIIPVNREYQAPNEGVEIFISSNGLHSSFIVPSVSEVFDWSHIIDDQPYQLDLKPAKHLAFGWGEKSIYLKVREWDQLTLEIGAKTLFLPTPSLMRVTIFEELPEEKMVKIRVTAQQYHRLCTFILDSFEKGPESQIKLIPGVGYSPSDNFYDAPAKYHAFNTCNSWSNRGLKQAGVRASLWASFDKSIFYQLRNFALDSTKTLKSDL